MLQAALLAQEQAGGIRFEIEDAGKQRPDAAVSLMVAPTGKLTDRGGVPASVLIHTHWRLALPSR